MYYGANKHGNTLANPNFFGRIFHFCNGSEKMLVLWWLTFHLSNHRGTKLYDPRGHQNIQVVPKWAKWNWRWLQPWDTAQDWWANDHVFTETVLVIDITCTSCWGWDLWGTVSLSSVHFVVFCGSFAFPNGEGDESCKSENSAFGCHFKNHVARLFGIGVSQQASYFNTSNTPVMEVDSCIELIILFKRISRDVQWPLAIMSAQTWSPAMWLTENAAMR